MIKAKNLLFGRQIENVFCFCFRFCFLLFLFLFVCLFSMLEYDSCLWCIITIACSMYHKIPLAEWFFRAVGVTWTPWPTTGGKHLVHLITIMIHLTLLKV